MGKFKIKSFDNVADQHKWLIANQDMLTAQRKSECKFSDGMGFSSFAIDEKGEQLKADNATLIDPTVNVIKIRCIINATNILDSHRDVHISGIWKKSLSENKLIYLCKEHMLNFEGIISDEVKAFTKNYTFKELGYNYDGETECLVFDAVIYKDRNPYMFEQYRKGHVKNHSVRMEYVKEYCCINTEEPDGAQYKENFDKYAPMVANQEDLKKTTWFYAQLEAKVKHEGSAVVVGSCFTTPTISVEPMQENNSQADKSLDNNEPLISTQNEQKNAQISIEDLKKNFNI